VHKRTADLREEEKGERHFVFASSRGEKEKGSVLGGREEKRGGSRSHVEGKGKKKKKGISCSIIRKKRRHWLAAGKGGEKQGQGDVQEETAGGRTKKELNPPSRIEEGGEGKSQRSPSLSLKRPVSERKKKEERKKGKKVQLSAYRANGEKRKKREGRRSPDLKKKTNKKKKKKKKRKQEK